MAPLFGKDDDMQEVAKNMQNLSEQIGALRKELAERNAQVEQLQQELTRARTQSSNEATSAANRLKESQAQMQVLQRQLAELQARAQQPAQPAAPAQQSGAEMPQRPATMQQERASAPTLTVGSTAWVTRAGGLPLRLRSRPGLAKDTIIDRLPPGTQMTLLEGPQSLDNHNWWHIRTSDGREGWVAGEDLRAQPD